MSEVHNNRIKTAYVVIIMYMQMLVSIKGRIEDEVCQMLVKLINKTFVWVQL